MSRIACQLRDDARREVERMLPGERVALALALGERDIDLFRRANGIPREEAARRLEETRRIGRRPSRCLEDTP